jgi:hypothetical protein
MTHMMPIFQPGRQTFKGERKSAHQRQGAADRGNIAKLPGLLQDGKQREGRQMAALS